MAKSAAEVVRDSGVAELAEKVPIFVPPAVGKEQDTMWIGVNGVHYTLPRGEQSNVPRFVAEEYRRAQAAIKAQRAYASEKQREAREIYR